MPVAAPFSEKGGHEPSEALHNGPTVTHASESLMSARTAISNRLLERVSRGPISFDAKGCERGFSGSPRRGSRDSEY